MTDIFFCIPITFTFNRCYVIFNLQLQFPVGCWEKSENEYNEYKDVLNPIQQDITPNARTEEELEEIDLR